jgi:16S rRNA (uracil1498-N3)-methyltransferase
MQRYFIDARQIEGSKVVIKDGDFHHIKHVMRLHLGDSVIVNTQDGDAYRCDILHFEDQKVILEIKEKIESKSLSYHLDIGLTMIKRDGFELALKKMTELGVEGIIPLMTDHSIIHIKDFEKKKIRYQSICKESSEQSERSYLPTIHDLSHLNDLDVSAYDHLFCAYAREQNQTLKDELKQIHSSDKSLVLIGPEGGFSKKEIELLKKKGFQNVSLGETILRAETAATYVASVFRFMLGD